MAAVIMVDRSASDSGRGVATAATNPSGAPADRVRSLKSIFGHFHESENALRLRLTEKGSDEPTNALEHRSRRVCTFQRCSCRLMGVGGTLARRWWRIGLWNHGTAAVKTASEDGFCGSSRGRRAQHPALLPFFAGGERAMTC